jgi:hypothetical protein
MARRGEIDRKINAHDLEDFFSLLLVFASLYLLSHSTPWGAGADKSAIRLTLRRKIETNNWKIKCEIKKKKKIYIVHLLIVCSHGINK